MQKEKFLKFILNVLVGVVPTIMILKLIQIDQITKLLYGDITIVADFFSFYKSKIIIALSLTLFFGFIFTIVFHYKKREFETLKNKNNYIILSMFVFILISFAFAPLKEISSYGLVDRYEGYYVWISYLMILLVTYNLKYTKKDLMIHGMVISISSAWISFIGITNVLGKDLLQTDFFQKVILMFEPRNVQMVQKGGKLASSTLFNSNYVGSYVALVLPLIIIFVINAEKRYQRVFGVISFALTIAFLWGSQSRAGYLGVIASLIYILFKLRKKILSHIKVVLVLGLIVVVSLVGVNKITDGRIARELLSLTKVDTVFNDETLSSAAMFDDINIEVSDIELIKGDQHIKYIFYNGLDVYLNDEKIEYELVDNKIIYEDDRLSYIDTYYNELTEELKLKVNNKQIEFVLIKNKVMVKGVRGKYFEYEDAAVSKIFKDRFASFRGYIWNRSIPLLMEKPLTGIGADVFVYKFPQNEILGRLNSGMRRDVIVDKPHNYYMQVGISFGIPFLLLLLGLNILGVIKKDKNVTISILKAGLIGFLVVSVFNDSNVSYALIYWFYLGLLLNKSIDEIDLY